MYAIIFSAGLGTRLRPLTNNKPKALVELNGKPLLWHAIQKLSDSGISQIIVNVHHFSEQIIAYLSANKFDIPIHISDESDMLLDTGGAIKNAQSFLQQSENFIAYNVDVISTVNISDIIKSHENSDALATLVVRDRKTSRYLLFDQEKHLTGWENINTGEQKISRNTFAKSNAYAFSGIQVISSEIFNYIEEDGKFSIIDLYLRLAKQHTVNCYIDHSDFWLDLGKPGQIELAEKML